MTERGNAVVEAAELQQRLRAILQSHGGGKADSRMLFQVRNLCALAAKAIADSYYKAKIAQVENYADALYSDRQYQRWVRNPWASVVYLREQMLVLLDTLDARLQHIQSVRRSERNAAPAKALSEPA